MGHPGYMQAPPGPYGPYDGPYGGADLLPQPMPPRHLPSSRPVSSDNTGFVVGRRPDLSAIARRDAARGPAGMEAHDPHMGFRWETPGMPLPYMPKPYVPPPRRPRGPTAYQQGQGQGQPGAYPPSARPGARPKGKAKAAGGSVADGFRDEFSVAELPPTALQSYNVKMRPGQAPQPGAPPRATPRPPSRGQYHHRGGSDGGSSGDEDSGLGLGLGLGMGMGMGMGPHGGMGRGMAGPRPLPHAAPAPMPRALPPHHYEYQGQLVGPNTVFGEEAFRKRMEEAAKLKAERSRYESEMSAEELRKATVARAIEVQQREMDEKKREERERREREQMHARREREEQFRREQEEREQADQFREATNRLKYLRKKESALADSLAVMRHEKAKLEEDVTQRERKLAAKLAKLDEKYGECAGAWTYGREPRSLLTLSFAVPQRKRQGSSRLPRTIWSLS
jgi:hypothetical protein